MARSLSLQVIAPAFAIMAISFFIPRFFIGTLDILLGYFLAYAALSPLFRERTRDRRYRFSFLRVLVSLTTMWEHPKWGKLAPLKRLVTPLLFSFLQILLMGAEFWYLPLCVILGWALFEVYYAQYLKRFLPMISAQRDDREIPPSTPNAESASAVDQAHQSPQTDSEKNS